MIRIIYITVLLFSALIFGQDTNQNYTKVITYRDTLSGSPLVQITYYDGLGRPIQNITHQQSNGGKDIVSHLEYDAFGRQIKDFLPFVNQSPSLSFNPNASADVLSFYSSNAYENTSNPFSEKLLEASPLNRVFKQASPGTDWQLNPSGQDHSIKFDYETNSDKNIVHYKVNAVWDANLELYNPFLLNATGNSKYDINQLYKTVTKDENWVSGKNNTTEEYKDKEGKVILKRTYSNYNDVINGSQTELIHDTHYVYDIYGNLTYVIPPMVDTENTITEDVLNEVCYQYKYDHRNRLVEKKLPGKQWEFIVYDKFDRVVSTGPVLNPWGTGEQGWMFTKYDEFNRVAYTGWHNLFPTTSSGRHQVVGQYQSNILSESRNEGLDFDYLMINYTNDVFPKVAKLLTVNYYDDYNYPNAPENIPSRLLSVDQDVYYNSTNLPKGMLTGTWVRILTNPDEVFGEFGYSLYDKKNRVVRNRTFNDYLGGYTQTDSQIHFSGKILLTETKHRRNEAAVELTTLDTYQYTAQDRLLLHKQQINGGQEQLIAKNSYDELGQLISKNVGGVDITGATGLQKVDYTYNIRGWLTGINNERLFNQSGLLLGSGDLFGFKINYNKTEGNIITNVTSLYNGNIAETFWQTGDGILRKYSYQYDNLNRLLKATYQKPNSVGPVPNSYNEEMGYDKNGNIQFLLRNGDSDTDSETFGAKLIDDLTYTYKPLSPNRLLKVIDKSNMSQGFNEQHDSNSDGITDTEEDYRYDEYGNMISDANKGIDSIVYNHLNLPIKINFGNLGQIEYVYTANGSKFQKKVIDNLGGTSAIIQYLNGFQYKNGTLQFFAHPEGYVNYTPQTLLEQPGTFNYVFNYTDHLGNIRLSYGVDPSTNELKIIEENHYYPFGLKHTNYNSDQLMYQKGTGGGITLRRPGPTTPPKPFYKYKYNGKELQDELGLNWYDYQARNYDPTIGRWMNIDPLAETSRRWNPYTYCYDNPMRFVDPDGMQADDWRNSKGQQVYNPKLNGGKGGYTEHATAKDRKYGETLRNSGAKGAEQFNTLVTTETKVSVTFSSDNVGSGDMYGFGFTHTNKPGDVTTEQRGTSEAVTKVNSAEIIVYEGTAERFVDDVNNGTAKVDASNPNEVADLKSIKEGGLTPTDVVSATLGHEIDHLDPKNVQMSRDEDKGKFRTDGTNSETKPQNSKTKILQDMAK